MYIIASHFSTDPATEDVDYTSTTRQVVFQSSDSIQYVEIPITDDGVFERTEFFYVNLAISAGSGSVGAPNTTTVFIIEEGENPQSLICMYMQVVCDNYVIKCICTYVSCTSHEQSSEPRKCIEYCIYKK